MPDNPSGDWSNVHPDFDGHLEKPLSEMTAEERLEWIWQGMLLLHESQKARLHQRPDAELGGAAHNAAE